MKAPDRKCARDRLSGVLVAFALFAVPGAGRAAEVPGLPAAVLKDFVWPDYYPPPHETQLRFRLRAAEATPSEGSWVQVRQVTLARFSPQGQTELFVQAERCLFHTGTQEARSEGPLELRLQGDRMTLEGVGFLWRQTNGWLVVSNRVRTHLRGGWLPRPGEGSAASRSGSLPDSEPLRIEADQFVYEGLRARAEFTGRVRVTGSNLVLRCERLEFELPGGPEGQVRQVHAEGSVEWNAEGLQARAARATLYPIQRHAILEGGVEWEKAEGTGAADLVEVSFAPDRLEARGNARLTLRRAAEGFLPRAALQAAGSKGGPVRIEASADHYRLAPDGARLEGRVRVLEVRAEGAPARLTCQRLEVVLASPGQLVSMRAEGDVELEDGDLHLTGQRATYRAEPGWVEVVGPATWRDGPRSGSGDRIWMDVAGPTFGVEGRAQMLWPRPATGALLGLAGPLPGQPVGTDPGGTAGSSLWTRVQCAAYVWSPAQLQFTGGVQVEDAQMQLTCGRLTVHLPADGTAGPDLTAQEQVVITLHTPGQPRVTATCEQALYRAETERLRLTGQPVIEREDGSRFTAEAVEYHRLTGVISTVGTVRARVESPDGLRLPAWPGLPGAP